MDVTVVVNEALISEIKRLRAKNAELQNELTKGIHTCGPTCRKTPRCAEMADLRAELVQAHKNIERLDVEKDRLRNLARCDCGDYFTPDEPGECVNCRAGATRRT